MKYVGIGIDDDIKGMNPEFLQALDYLADDKRAGETVGNVQIASLEQVLSTPEEKFFFILSDNFRGETQGRLKELGFVAEKDFMPAYDWYGSDAIPAPYLAGTWDEFQKTWDYDGETFMTRKRLMKSMLDFSKIKSIADMGCGTMGLKDMLPEGVRYIPVDYIRRDENTVLCDFNKEEFPDFNAILGGRVDNIFLSGVLRYIIDWRSFLTKCRESSNSVIVTYFVGGHNINKLQAEWRHRGYMHTAPLMDLVSEFLQDGWTLRDHAVYRRVTQILYFERNE